MSERAHTVCIAGYGGRAEEQVEALLEHEGAWRIAAVADRSAVAYGRLQARYYDLRIPMVRDVRELVAFAPDVVLVSTTAAAHTPIALALIDAGYTGALLVEKPLASSVAAGRTLASAVAAWPGRVAVGFQRRCSPMYLAVVEAIRSELGAVESVAYTASAPLKLSMEGSHTIDLVNWLVGARPVSVSARLAEEATIDRRGSFYFDPAGVVDVAYDGGVTFTLDGTGAGDGQPGLHVVCERGTVSVDHKELGTTLTGPSGTRTIESDADRARANRVWFERTLRALLGLGDGEPCTADEGLAALEIVAGAFFSGGDPVALPLSGEAATAELRVA